MKNKRKIGIPLTSPINQWAVYQMVGSILILIKIAQTLGKTNLTKTIFTCKTKVLWVLLSSIEYNSGIISYCAYNFCKLQLCLRIKKTFNLLFLEFLYLYKDTKCPLLPKKMISYKNLNKFSQNTGL